MRSGRLLRIGWLILTSGLISVAVLYVVQTRAADPQPDDVGALGYTRSLQHGMGVMMGPSGVGHRRGRGRAF